LRTSYIGAGFFIDHGTGVAIGETAVIGQRVRVWVTQDVAPGSHVIQAVLRNDARQPVQAAPSSGAVMSTAQ
jgi:serine acetyltransferase